MNAAVRAAAIVFSLFPTQVPDRLMENQENIMNGTKSGYGLGRSRSPTPRAGVAPGLFVRTEGRHFFGSKSITDLFPEVKRWRLLIFLDSRHGPPPLENQHTFSLSSRSSLPLIDWNLVL
jgi:hypothetical protein